MSLLSKQNRRNVLYSVVDYASQPVLMLAVAPLLLRALGVQQYGTWMLVNSIAAVATGLGGGFGDAAIKYVSMYRGCGDKDGALRSMIAVLAVNCAFGVLSGAIIAGCAPWLIDRVFRVEVSLRHVGIVGLRISAALLVIRFAETVFTSAIRGCERYRPTVTISVVCRSATTLLALVLAVTARGLITILWATLFVAALSLAGQVWVAHKVLPMGAGWRPRHIRSALREVSSFGTFTWLKSTLGVLISHGDRLLVAGLLGTAPLAFYSLCNQITQSIPALTGAASSFVFPNFSAKVAAGRWFEVKRDYHSATLLAGVVIAAVSAGIVVIAKPVLRLWLGPAVAAGYHELLIAMAIGNGLLAVSVIPHYAALAFGRARALVLVNLAAGLLSLGSGYFLIRFFGVMGAGFGKIIAGAVFLSVFGVVRLALQQNEHATPVQARAVTATADANAAP